MNRLVILVLLLILCTALQAADSPPIALLFPVTPDKGTSQICAVETTQAIKTYMRQIGKADIADFQPDSPLVERAIMEHRIKAEDMGKATTPEAKLQLAGLIGTDLVLSGDVLVTEDKVTVNVWIAKTKTEKFMHFQAWAGISLNSNRDRAISNAIQSATSSIIYKLSEEALKDVKAGLAAVQPTDEGPNAPLVEPAYNQPKNVEVETLLSKAGQFVKDDDLANAILTYRDAVNADPRNVDIRIKLIRLYTERKMFSQALDEVERAKLIDPENEALRAELAHVYEKRGTPEKAAEIYTNVAEKNPNDIDARIKAGDYQWQIGKFDEAEKQYRIAAQIDETNPSPYARLSLLFASRSMYGESLKGLGQMQKISSNAELKVFTDTYYPRFMSIAEKDLNDILTQLDNGYTSFSQKETTREAYYNQVQDLSKRAQSISALLQALTPPEDRVSINRHRVLGCSLLSQSCASMLRYLETNKTSEKEDADIFLTEAKKHITAN
ncbi:MAG: tetratricopeptide repeat protein [Armatimonadota bacterium]